MTSKTVKVTEFTEFTFFGNKAIRGLPSSVRSPLKANPASRVTLLWKGAALRGSSSEFTDQVLVADLWSLLVNRTGSQKGDLDVAWGKVRESGTS